MALTLPLISDSLSETVSLVISVAFKHEPDLSLVLSNLNSPAHDDVNVA